MSGVIHTKRVFPYSVGRVDGALIRNWDNPEGCLVPDDDQLASHLWTPNAPRFSFQPFRFSLDIPSFAVVQAIRWLTRARLESPYEVGEVMLYEVEHMADGSFSAFRSDTSNFHGNQALSEVATPIVAGNQAFLHFLNEHREARSDFSLNVRAGVPADNPRDVEQTLWIDYIALEFDYTLPEFPLQVDLRIE